MMFEKRKKGIIAIIALLLAAFIAGGVFSVSAKYTSKLSTANTYVQVGLKLDPNYEGAADSQWRTVSPVNGQAMPSVTPPARDGYIFTGYYSEDGTPGHEQSDANRYYKNDGTSYKNWDASCNVLYAGWDGTHSITFNATANDGELSGTNPLYVKFNDATLYSDSTATTIGTVPNAAHTGLTFVGWYTHATGGMLIIDKNGTIQANKTEFTNSGAKWILEEDKTLYAHYAAEVTFDDGIGTYSGTDPLYAKYNDSKLFSDSDATNETSVPAATHANLRFVGWFTVATGGTPIIDKDRNILPNKTGYTDASGNWIMHNSITLYAQYAAKITFDAGENGGKIKETTDTEKELYARYSDSSLYVSAETNASKADDVPLAEYDGTHLFKGWYTAKTGGMQIIDKDGNVLTNKAGYTDAAGKWIPEEDKTLFAQFDVIHTLSFVNMTSSSGTLVETYYGFNGVLYNESTLNTRVTSMPSVSNGSRTGLSYWTTTKTGKVGSGSLAAAAPVVISAGNVVIGTYTDENGQSFTIGGTSDWTLNSDITLYAVWYTVNYYKDTGRLPDGYIELEYIASTDGGYQGINTGYVPDNKGSTLWPKYYLKLDFEIKASKLDKTRYFYKCGNRDTFTWCSFQNDQSGASWNVGERLIGDQAYHVLPHPLDFDRHSYIVDYNTPSGSDKSITVSIDGSFFGSHDYSGYLGDNGLEFTIFKGGDNSTAAAVRYYYFNMYDGTARTNPVRTLVPAKYGNTLGMYDITPSATKKFYQNSGSGTFVTEYYTQVFAYGETGNLYPAVTVTPADGLPQEQATDSYDCGYTSTTGGTLLGWSLSGDRPKTYDIGGTNAVSGKELWKSIEGTEGDLHVDLYTVWSDSRMLTSVFHSMNKSTEYYYQAPAEEETE